MKIDYFFIHISKILSYCKNMDKHTIYHTYLIWERGYDKLFKNMIMGNMIKISKILKYDMYNNMIKIFQNMIKFNPGNRYHVSSISQWLISLWENLSLSYLKYDNMEYDKDLENMIKCNMINILQNSKYNKMQYDKLFIFFIISNVQNMD